MNKKISTLAILACLSISIIAISIPVKLVRGYTLVPPIVIASNADFDLYDSGGDGSPLNPWIIENIEIDCASAGSGISISGTTDYAIIRDSYIHNSGSGALDAGIAISGSINIELLNITVEDAGAFGIVLYLNGNNCTIKNCSVSNTGDAGIALAFGADSNNITGNTLRNCSIVANTAAINLMTVSNDIIEYNDIDQDDLVQAGIDVTGNCDFIVINGNLINNTEITPNAMGITTLAASHLTVTNNRVDDSPASLEFQSTINSYIANNTLTDAVFGGIILDINDQDNIFTGNSVENAAYGVYITTGATNQSIIHNSFINCTSVAIENDDLNTPVIEWNWIENCGHAVFSLYGTTVSRNYFKNTPITLLTDPDIFDSNYYADYFDDISRAFDITTNTTMDELTSTYTIDAAHDDSHPRYYAPFYPRGTMVFLNFFSNVDGLGISFSNLHVLLDLVPLTVTYPTIPHVLFRLTVSVYTGRLLYDQILNLNSTGIYIDIGLDIAVQIFVRYFSSIDGLGLPFDLVLLYIDGVQINRFDPIMDHEILNITITSGFNVTIYSRVLNLSVTGVNVNIFLSITWITFTNNHDYKVIFKLSAGSNSTSITMAPGISVQYRLAMGVYTYSITAANGSLIENGLLEFKATEPENFVIDFGPIHPVIPVTIYVNTANILNYIIFFGIIAIAIYFGIKSSNKAKKKREYH